MKEEDEQEQKEAEEEEEWFRATLVDHGFSTREAGQRVQPNLSHYMAASIIRTFLLLSMTFQMYLNIKYWKHFSMGNIFTINYNFSLHTRNLLL